ncbi:MAG TPA: hypothetical protein VFJ05_01755 [Nitrososphaeraceae archaeon]|nr:hypothetical protein [Nitrososphaeraceae archaeon]
MLKDYRCLTISNPAVLIHKMRVIHSKRGKYYVRRCLKNYWAITMTENDGKSAVRDK